MPEVNRSILNLFDYMAKLCYVWTKVQEENIFVELNKKRMNLYSGSFAFFK